MSRIFFGKSLLIAGAMALASAGAGNAQTVPALSGTDLVHIQDFCGAEGDPWPDGLSTQFDGGFVATIGTATFYSTNNTVDFTGYQADTQLVVPNSKGGATSLAPVTLSAVSYSNTATTFTFQGRTYQVIYGDVTSGVVQNMEWVGDFAAQGVDSPNCFQKGEASIVTP